MTDEAKAFVPGHVTGFFAVERTDDPTTTGSRGGGLTLSDGVTVTVRPDTETEILLDDVSVDIGAVEGVLEALGIEATVIGETDLPLGSGFGVSGAMALGTALAATDGFDLELSMAELTTVAHGAEVQAGTGLGDVVAQARGGMVLRLEAGGPRANELDGLPARPRVEYLTLGELDTSDVIGGDTERLSAAGDDALSRVVEQPTVEQFMYASRRFAREAGLLTPDVKDVIMDVTEAGGEASMAMLGETVFALGTGLSDAGYDPHVCRVDPTGATVLGGSHRDQAELQPHASDGK
ncbi:sugar kinase [Halorhabdus sp. CBA1104]|uniref:pantoate kinase n=1 Tax=Halorhabdus sp. CBA1104 TaxID=1380432 RepID=UPI0012B2B1B1|nr:pantoate kinase [Halorhabdus sp. CBA1104]QGN08157.1 sugar kinase [Halorhabdus sp. CBA1104]